MYSPLCVAVHVPACLSLWGVGGLSPARICLDCCLEVAGTPNPPLEVREMSALPPGWGVAHSSPGGEVPLHWRVGTGGWVRGGQGGANETLC